MSAPVPAEIREASRKRYRKRYYAENREAMLRKSRAYRKANASKVAETRRIYYQSNKAVLYERKLLRQFGLTKAEYDQLFAKQKGRCAICLCRPERGFHVDHNHKTNAVRGLLCSDCNTGIGLLRDSTKALERALAYLKSPPFKRKAP